MKTDHHALAAECRDVARLYRSDSGSVLALRGIDAAFPSATLSAVIGPSGAGKSTLLRMLAGIDVPDAGRVLVAGVDLASLSLRKRRAFVLDEIAFVFQRPSQNVMPNYSVRDHFDLAVRLHPGAAPRLADEVADRLGLRDRMSEPVRDLSASRRQQLAIGLALVGRASLVIADEPTAELDPDGAELLLQTMRDATDMGSTFIVASHDPVLMDEADQVIAIHDGVISERRVRGGDYRAVIDPRGRLQLPRWAIDQLPTREAAVVLDDATHRIYLTS